MTGLRRLGNQLVGLAGFIGIIILANALSALGAPGVVAWGGAVVLVILLVAAWSFGRRQLKLWRDKPLGQWQKLDSRALALQKQGERNTAPDALFTQAEGLYKQALEVAEASARPPLIATASNNLASLFCDQRRFGDAEPLFQRALELREAHVGPDDQSTVSSIERLSGLYVQMDRWADAERMQRRALESYRRADPKGPGVAQTLNAIAVALRHQDKIDEADLTYSEAFAAVTSENSDEAG